MVDPLAVGTALETGTKLGLFPLIACDMGNYAVADMDS
jgi:hypothetical protein